MAEDDPELAALFAERMRIMKMEETRREEDPFDFFDHDVVIQRIKEIQIKKQEVALLLRRVLPKIRNGEIPLKDGFVEKVAEFKTRLKTMHNEDMQCLDMLERRFATLNSFSTTLQGALQT